MNTKLLGAVWIVCIAGFLAVLLVLPHGTHGSTHSDATVWEDSYPEPDENVTVQVGSATYGMTISADKYTYKSNEKIQMAINITASSAADGLELRVRGVKNRMNSYKVKKDIVNLTLDEGFNQRVVNATVPSCYGCAAISPGVYDLEAMLFENGTSLINASTKIEIVK